METSYRNKKHGFRLSFSDKPIQDPLTMEFANLGIWNVSMDDYFVFLLSHPSGEGPDIRYSEHGAGVAVPFCLQFLFSYEGDFW